MLTLLGSLVVIAAVVALGAWLDRRGGGLPFLPRPEALRERARRRLPVGDHAPGAAPATAMPVDPDGVPALVASQRCDGCRAALRLDGEDEVRFDGRTLRALRLRCSACDRRRGLYVAPRAPDGA